MSARSRRWRWGLCGAALLAFCFLLGAGRREARRPGAIAARSLARRAPTPMAPADAERPHPPERDAPPPALAQGPVAPPVAPEPSPHFEVRWRRPGHCPDGREDLLERRAALLATFAPAGVAEGSAIAVDRELVEHAPPLAAKAVQAARAKVLQFLGPGAAVPPPAVWVYRDPAQLRSVACVGEGTVGYYDGAIHVAWPPGEGPEQARLTALWQTTTHEYAHHALGAFGVERPMWLHEGLAMRLAAERWFENPDLGLHRWLERSPFTLAQMVDAFPYGAEERFALAVYFQSHRMVEHLASQRGDEALRELIIALAARRVAPEDAFAHAAGLPPEAAAEAFRAALRPPPPRH